MSSVLVVDDEAQMLSIVTFAMETQGFSCVTASTASQAWEKVTAEHFDLVVLDVMLPRGSGLDLTRRIRSQYPTLPIILLTALSDESHRIAGLEAGADDYLTKPFSPRELALRAQAILRRMSPSDAHALIEYGPFRVDQRSHSVLWNNRPLPISDTEERLLAALVSRRGAIASHREILNEVWATNLSDGGREMIKTTVYRLRKALAKMGADPSVIRAHRGEGYLIDLG